MTNNTQEYIDITPTSDLMVSGEQLHEGTQEHEGPHIPLIQGETVWGPISNVTVTTLLFLAIVTGVAFTARRQLMQNSSSKLKTFFLNFIHFFDGQLRDAFGDKSMARKYFPLIVGMFFIIFFGNLFGLIIDWLIMSVSPTLGEFVRPIHSDLNTTLSLGLIVVVMMLVIQVQSSGGFHAAKSYLWNAQGSNVGEKGINVFVGWLHMIGVPATLASLSLRLFGNIFAGIVLIGVISFLMATATANFLELGRLIAIPFWFFEVFVALIQAIVFSYLMIAYFKGASEH